MRKCIVAALALSVLMPLVAMAAPPAPLADRVPAESLAFVSWAGQNKAFDASAMGQLLQEPATAKIVAALVAAAEKDMSHEEQRALFHHGLAMADILWRHEIALCLMDMQLHKEGVDESQFDGVLLVELGKDQAAFDEHLQAVLKVAPEGILQPVKIGDIEFSEVQGITRNKIRLGYVGTMLVLALGDKAVETIVNLKADKSLAANKEFAARLQAVGGADVQMATYVDVKNVMARIDKLQKEAANSSDAAGEVVEEFARSRKIVDALGLAKVTALVSTVRVVDGGMLTRTKVFSPAPHRGVLMPLANATLTEADLAAIPADADFAVALKLSPSDVYAELRRVIKQIDPDADKQFARNIGQMENALKISLQQDVLDSLGDSWTLSMADSQGGFLTGVCLTASVKDEAKLKAALAKTEGFFKERMAPSTQSDPSMGDMNQSYRRFPKLESYKSDKAAISYIVPDRNSPVAPAWAVHKGRFYLALWPQVVETVIDRAGGKSLAKDPVFAKARLRLSPNATSVGYFNTPRMVRAFYGLAMMGWTIGANEASREIRSDVKMDWLPALSKIEKYLWPSISAVTADNQGITFESYGAFPSLLNIAHGAALNPLSATAAAIGIAESRKHAQRLRSINMLRNLSLGVMNYANDNSGQMPENLSQLKNNFDPRTLAELEKDVTYVRLPSGTSGQVMMAWENPAKYKNKGTNVAYADCTVRWVSMQEFKEKKAELDKLLKGETSDF